ARLPGAVPDEPVDRDDAGVLQAAGDLRLPEETPAVLRIGGPGPLDALGGYVPRKVLVQGGVGLAPPPARGEAHRAIAADAVRRAGRRARGREMAGSLGAAGHVVPLGIRWPGLRQAAALLAGIRVLKIGPTERGDERVGFRVRRLHRGEARGA